MKLTQDLSGISEQRSWGIKAEVSLTNSLLLFSNEPCSAENTLCLQSLTFTVSVEHRPVFPNTVRFPLLAGFSVSRGHFIPVLQEQTLPGDNLLLVHCSRGLEIDSFLGLGRM